MKNKNNKNIHKFVDYMEFDLAFEILLITSYLI